MKRNDVGIDIYKMVTIERRSRASASLGKKSEHLGRESENRFANVSFINRNEERVVSKEIYRTNILSAICTYQFFSAYLHYNYSRQVIAANRRTV